MGNHPCWMLYLYLRCFLLYLRHSSYFLGCFILQCQMLGRKPLSRKSARAWRPLQVCSTRILLFLKWFLLFFVVLSVFVIIVVVDIAVVLHEIFQSSHTNRGRCQYQLTGASQGLVLSERFSGPDNNLHFL